MLTSKIMSMTCLVPIIYLGACSAPDISTELDSSVAAFSQIEQPLDAIIEAGEARELALQIDALIRAGDDIYVPSEACYIVGNNGFAMEPCEVEEIFTPSRDLARYRNVRQILLSMRDYFDALAELSSSDTPEKISANAKGVFVSLAGLSDVSTRLLPETLNSRIQQRATSTPLVLQYAAEQARSRALRNAVRTGDAAVEETVLLLIAYLREADKTPSAAGLSQITNAERALEAARLSGNSSDYAQQLSNFQTTIENVETARATSLYGKLIALRLAHREMAEKLLAPASLAEVRDAVDAVNEIADARAQEEQSQ